MKMNAIVLRNIPKEEARLGLFRCKIQGGFRGFYSDAPILGWHYVSIKVQGMPVGFWCNLSPGEAIVRTFDPARGLVEDDPNTVEQYAQMALSGAMEGALVAYPPLENAHWFSLVCHIKDHDFPPQIHPEELGAGSRFEKALLGTHKGDTDSFLAEFQYAFIRWWVSLDTGTMDEVAFARWQHLLLSVYNAGEKRMASSGKLFPSLVNAMLWQFRLLPPDWFKPDTFVTAQANYLAEDLIDTDIQELVDAGQAFKKYLKQRN